MITVRKIVAAVAVATSLLCAQTPSIYETVAGFEKGMDGYIIGRVLTAEQELLMQKNSLKSNNKHVMKFLANDNLLIAINAENKAVIVINKRHTNVDQNTTRKLLGQLIYEYDEPTAMAHDTLVYWVFNDKNEKLSEDDLQGWKDSLKEKTPKTLADAVKEKKSKSHTAFNPYVTVKLSSDQPIMTKVKEPKPATVNIIISSDKLMQDTIKMVVK